MKPDVGEVREYHRMDDIAGRIIFVVLSVDQTSVMVLFLSIENCHDFWEEGNVRRYSLTDPLMIMSDLVALGPP